MLSLSKHRFLWGQGPSTGSGRTWAEGGGRRAVASAELFNPKFKTQNSKFPSSLFHRCLKGIYNLEIIPRPNLTAYVGQCLIRAQLCPIRALLKHGTVGVDDGKNTGQEGDFFTLQPIGVAAAVVLFVVMQDGLAHIFGIFDISQHLVSRGVSFCLLSRSFSSMSISPRS